VKLLHFSDLHIGVENYGRPDPETGFSTRLLDFLKTFDEMVNYAIESDVDVVLFAGDAYKNRDPSQTHQREFARRITKLANQNIPIYLVTGNHDLPNIAGRASAIEIFPTLEVERVFISDHISTTIIPTKSGPLQILGVPWIRRSQFLTRDDTRNLTVDQITHRVEERLTSSLIWEMQRLDPKIPAVLVGHITVSGSMTGTERSMMLGRDHVLMLSTMSNAPLDYVALGHIHKHQILGYNPMVVYSGSLQRVDFSEEKEDKGFCVIDIDETKPQGNRLNRFDFHPVQARIFLTIDVDIHQNDDPTQKVLDAIFRKKVDGSIVRVRIKLPEHLEPQFREGEVRKALSNAHYIAAIQRNVIRERRTRITPEASRGISPKEALRLYFKSRNTAPHLEDVLMQQAETLMREERGEENE
jgi:exonuclease SbcD